MKGERRRRKGKRYRGSARRVKRKGKEEREASVDIFFSQEHPRLIRRAQVCMWLCQVHPGTGGREIQKGKKSESGLR